MGHKIVYYLWCSHYHIIPLGNKGVFLSGKFTKEGSSTEKNKSSNGTKKRIYPDEHTRNERQEENSTSDPRGGKKTTILLNIPPGIMLALVQISQKLDVVK